MGGNDERMNAIFAALLGALVFAYLMVLAIQAFIRYRRDRGQLLAPIHAGTNESALELHQNALSVAQDIITDVLTLETWWPIVNGAETQVLVVGESRSGKSVHSLAIMKQRAKTDHIIVFDPHYAAGAWGGIKVFGAARNFREIDEGFLAIEKLIQARFIELKEVGQWSGPPITIFIDEYPAIAEGCIHAKRVFLSLLRETLKIGIRLVVLAQDKNVATLGIEGQGAVLRVLVKVLLGSFAGHTSEGFVKPASIETIKECRPIDNRAIPSMAKADTPVLAYDLDFSGIAVDAPGGAFTEKHVLLALAVSRNPNASVRELARLVFPATDGGGSYSTSVKKMLNEIGPLLGAVGVTSPVIPVIQP